MSYSTSESTITTVAEAVDKADAALRRLHRDAENIIARLDGSLAGAAAAETEIDTNAPGSDLWTRLKERKDAIKTDMQTIKTAAETIEAAIQANLP